MNDELPHLSLNALHDALNPCISASDTNPMGRYLGDSAARGYSADRESTQTMLSQAQSSSQDLRDWSVQAVMFQKIGCSAQPRTWSVLFAAPSFLFPVFTWKICFSLFSFAHLSLSLSFSSFRSLLIAAKLTTLPTSLAAPSKSVIVTAEAIPRSFLSCCVIACTARSKTCQPARPSKEVRRDEVPV